MNSEIRSELETQATTGRACALATVVAVHGSASARVGSKAVFSAAGENRVGWVGGGCAETFVGEQVVEAIAERSPRTVHVNLDDEILGLGIACGGTMDVFIDPILPPEPLPLPNLKDAARQARLVFLAESLGFRPEAAAGNGASVSLPRPAELEPGAGDGVAVYRELAAAIAALRGRDLASLRDRRSLPVRFAPARRVLPETVVLVGQTRITEALARFLAQLGVAIRLIAPQVYPDNLPGTVTCACGGDDGRPLGIPTGAAVVVASHLPADPRFVREALEAGSPYAAMVGSRKRALEVLVELRLEDGAGAQASAAATPATEAPAALHVPAGLDIDARTPEEIALSILAEMGGPAGFRDG